MTQAQNLTRDTIPSDKARQFFLYQDDEDIIDAYAKMIEADPEDVQLRVDWGTDSRNRVIGGDVIIGPKHGGKSLDDEDLVELALSMGAGDWVQPNYDPQWRVASCV